MLEVSKLGSKSPSIIQCRSAEFYDTFVTRNDIIQMQGSDIKSYLIQVIERFEEQLKQKKFSAGCVQMVTFDYYVNSSVSQATWDAQQQCKHSIFAEYLVNVYRYCEKHGFTFEQSSILMSISFFIFAESLECKITQIDSYEKFKRILKSQINLTNSMNVPSFNQGQIMDFNGFMTESFYKFYSLYELRMIIYQEVNIYSKLKSDAQVDTFIQEEEDEQGSIIDGLDDDGQDDNGSEKNEEVVVQQERKVVDSETVNYLESKLSEFNHAMEMRLEQQEQSIQNKYQEALKQKK